LCNLGYLQGLSDDFSAQETSCASDNELHDAPKAGLNGLFLRKSLVWVSEDAK
jgi:hypothetical protein